MIPSLLLRFISGGRAFALPLGLVREVAELEDVIDIPRSPPGIAGLVEVGGRIVTLVDPGAGASGPAADHPELRVRRAVVLSAPPGHLALLAEEPLDIVESAGPLERASGPSAADTEDPEAAGCSDSPDGSRDTILLDGTRCRLIDPARLVECAARAIRNRYRGAAE